MIFHCSHKNALGNHGSKWGRENGLARFPQIHGSHHNNKASFYFFQNKSLVEEGVTVDICSDDETWEGAETEPGERFYFHSAKRESGFILFEKASRVPA